MLPNKKVMKLEEKSESKQSLMVLSIVAIVAIISLVFLFNQNAKVASMSSNKNLLGKAMGLR